MSTIKKPGEFLAGKKIFVIGGGIAGLTFVTALHQLLDPELERPKITLYEHEPRTIAISKDTYIMTLRGASKNDGLAVLRDLDLLDEILPFSKINSGSIRVYDEKFKEVATRTSKGIKGVPAAIKVPREDVMRVLIRRAEKAKNTTFQYNSSFTRASKDDCYEAYVANIFFASPDGEFKHVLEDCDYIIAADGRNSNVHEAFCPRDMITKYSGANQIGGVSYFSGGIPKPLSEDYSLQLSSGQGVACTYTPYDYNYVGWALSTMGPEREFKTDFGLADFTALKKEALTTGSMFDEQFKAIVNATNIDTAYIKPAKDRGTVNRSSSTMIQHFKDNMRGVVFIGDAGHMTNNFELNGADLALKDAWNLAEQLSKAKNWKDAITKYEELTLATYEKAQKQSMERLGFVHATGIKWNMFKYGMAAQQAAQKAVDKARDLTKKMV